MIKLIALLTMLIDHIGIVLFPQHFIFRIIGRVSMPLFAYCVARGFYYSNQRGSLHKYLLNMLIFALISQLPYYLMVGEGLNIGFTWLFSLLLLSGTLQLDSAKNSKAAFETMLMVVLLLGASCFLPIDYGIYGVITPLLFYILIVLKKENAINYAVALVAGWAVYAFLNKGSPGSMVQLISVAGAFILTVSKLHDNKVKLPKWFFYSFYPTHMALLVFVKYLYF